MEENLICVSVLVRLFKNAAMSLTLHAILSILRLPKVSFRHLPMKRVLLTFYEELNF